MDVKTAKAAILVASGKPLIVDEFTLPVRPPDTGGRHSPA
ncbi:hypothetical protein ACVIIV_000995 [Bradyrhizobium sp. USDA 4354]